MKILKLLSSSLLFIVNSNAQPAYVFHDKGFEKLEAKNYLEAIKDFDMALSKDKNHAPSYCDKARAESELGKKEEALKDFDATIKLKPDYADAYYYRGLMYFKNKDNKAILDFNKVISLDAKKVDAYLKLAQLYVNEKKDDEALANYNKAIELKINDANVFYQRGLLLVNKNKNAEAMADFNAVIKANPTHNAATFERGKIFMAQQKYNEALKDFTVCVNSKMNSEQLFLLRSKIYLLLGKNDEALRDANVLADLYKTKDPNVYALRAQIAFSKKDYVNTIKDCGKTIMLDKSKYEMHLLRAKAYYAQGKSKFPLALNDFKKVTELNTDNIEAWNSYGNLLFETNKYNDALIALEKSIAIKPGADNYYLRSKCQFKLNNKKACCADLQKAADLGNKEALKDLAIVCR